MFSTLRTYLGGAWETNNTKMTSADPFTLVRFLKQAQDLGVKYLVLEVSSHAIYYQRIWGIDFDVAAVTNSKATWKTHEGINALLFQSEGAGCQSILSCSGYNSSTVRQITNHALTTA